jgi:hypothetical protein
VRSASRACAIAATASPSHEASACLRPAGANEPSLGGGSPYALRAVCANRAVSMIAWVLSSSWD